MRAEILENLISKFEIITPYFLAIDRHKWEYKKRTLSGEGLLKIEIQINLISKNQTNKKLSVSCDYKVNTHDRKKTFDFSFSNDDDKNEFENLNDAGLLNDIIEEYKKYIVIPEFLYSVRKITDMCEGEIII